MFDVAGEAAVAPDRGQGALDDPPPRQHLEAFGAGLPAHDLEPPFAGLCDDAGRLCALIALVGEDDDDEGKALSRPPVQHQRRAVPVLYAGGVDHDPQHQAERADEQVLLDAFGLLARVEPGFLAHRPPF